MTEHHRHTEFLKHCLTYDDSCVRHQMREKLSRLQRDVYTIQRASWLMGVLIGLAVVGLAYPTILVQNFPYNLQQPIMNVIFGFFIGLVISLVTFMVLRMIFLRKLDHHREECRQRLTRLMATRLGPQLPKQLLKEG